MSILIKGIKMPKNCGNCPCAHIFDGYKCMAAKRPFDKYPLDNRMDWCPLIPVPPSAYVRPVKRGKWMYKKITTDLHVVGQCSVCKERRIIDNFCPNCGAEMEGE